MKNLFQNWIFGIFLCLPSLAFTLTNIDSCDYYQDLDDKLQCGDKSYIADFAQPYCNVYLKNKDLFSPQAKIILRKIRQCLQNSLAKNETVLNCSTIATYGFESHTPCYIKNDFCKLSTIDKTLVYWMAKKEIVNPQVWKMMVQIQYQCLFF
jgi:hypothetical protein